MDCDSALFFLRFFKIFLVTAVIYYTTFVVMLKRNDISKAVGIRGALWLLVAVVCIVFSSASKRVIELRYNPAASSTHGFFDKKIKDGSRDKHTYFNAVSHSVQQSPVDHDNDLAALFLLSSFITLAYFYFYRGGNLLPVFSAQRVISPGCYPLYLQLGRLQV